MDIFKNVQNRKVKESFEKLFKKERCDENDDKFSLIIEKSVTINFVTHFWV